MEGRVPTFAFTVDGVAPDAVAVTLAEQGIAVWAGNYYALEVIRALGFEESGGTVRAGFVHYNTQDEVDRLLDALALLV
jgi:selenocysteine lyase/cysteine desulfurase